MASSISRTINLVKNVRAFVPQSRLLSQNVPADLASKDLVKSKTVVIPKGVEGLEPKVDRHSLTITVEGADDISLINGVPEEHIKSRKVVIKRPTKNAMQSGTKTSSSGSCGSTRRSDGRI